MTLSEILEQAVPAAQVAELKVALKQLEEAMSIPIKLPSHTADPALLTHVF